jgi:LysR family hydrogen peroxide-inducible transcriptional activator
MTIQQLEYIVALDNHNNFVRAAEACNVTQPTLTMQVQKLEDEIGFLVFDRSKKPFTVTRLGKVFVQHSREILSRINNLREQVNYELETVEGTFRMGIIPTLAPYLLPYLLPDFIKNYPKTKLVIEELQSEIVIEQIKNGKMDVAILSGPVDDTFIQEHFVYSEPFLVYHHEQSPLREKKLISTSDLDLDKLLLLSEGHCFRNQTLNICGKDDLTEVGSFSYYSGSIESIMALVDKGLGYTLIPELAVFKAKGLKNTKRFQHPQPARDISIISHTAFHKQAFVDAIRKTILKTSPPTSKKMNALLALDGGSKRLIHAAGFISQEIFLNIAVNFFP